MRYQVYGWYEDEADDYLADYEQELEDALEKGYRDPMDYGTPIGESDSAERALSMTSDNYLVSAVWDTKRRVWFN